jgi:hypothetical protein
MKITVEGNNKITIENFSNDELQLIIKAITNINDSNNDDCDNDCDIKEKFKVKDIAELFSVNCETVRKWVRDKRIKSCGYNSRREGNIFTIDGVREFAKDNAKYRNVLELKGLI